MLELAKPWHEEEILSLVHNFYAQTKFSKDPLNEDKIRSVIQSCTDPARTDNVLLLWVEEDTIQGLLAGQATEMITLGSKVATEIVWWVEPEYRKTGAADRLLEAFEYWANLTGCDRVQMFALQNEYTKAISRFYRTKDYHLAELSFVKEL